MSHGAINNNLQLTSFRVPPIRSSSMGFTRYELTIIIIITTTRYVVIEKLLLPLLVTVYPRANHGATAEPGLRAGCEQVPSLTNVLTLFRSLPFPFRVIKSHQTNKKANPSVGESYFRLLFVYLT